MKKTLNIFWLILLGLVSCEKSHYQVNVQFEDVIIEQSQTQIFFDQTAVGWESELQNENDFQYLVISIPDSVKIPVNSQVVSGYIDFLGTRGIRVIPNESTEHINKGDTIKGIYSEAIVIKQKKPDSTMINKIFEIMEYVIKKDSISE